MHNVHMYRCPVSSFTRSFVRPNVFCRYSLKKIYSMKLSALERVKRLWKKRTLPALKKMKCFCKAKQAKLRRFTACLWQRPWMADLPPWPLVVREGEIFAAAKFAESIGHPVVYLKRDETLDRLVYEALCLSLCDLQELWL